MKVNLQKIIALIAVLAVTVSILNIAVFALEADIVYVMGREVYNDTTALIDDYVNGNVELNELLTGLATIQGNAVLSGLDYEANKVGKLINSINRSTGGSEHGGGGSGGSRSPITDMWNDICNNYNVPTETTQTSKENFPDGCGAFVIIEESNGDMYKIPCDYILVNLDSDGNINSYTEYGNSSREVYVYEFRNGSWERSIRYDIYFEGSSHSYSTNIHFYGDVRYVDGTPAPTDDEYDYNTIKKFDEMNDKEINDLLNYLIDELNRQNPDLSSIEGLLTAIYARLGTLDSDNDNQLLSQILAAIKALEKYDDSEVLALLNDIKYSLIYGNENIEDLSEQLKNIIDNMILSEDFEIDEDIYNNRLEVLKNRILGKFSFIYNIKNFVENCFEQYSSTENIPEISFTYCGKQYNIDFSFFNEYIVLVQWLIAGFVYASYAYHTYRKMPSYINGGDNE